MIVAEWRKFKGWAVLEFFLRKESAYIKELSRLLKISPRTAQIYTRLYENEGLLRKEVVGNTSVYRITDTPLAKEMKRLYLLLMITPGIKKLVHDNPSVTSLALYGSGARGEYDQSSDIDLLAISGSKEMNLGGIKELEGTLFREAKVEVISIGRWRELGGKKDDFYLSVVKSNIPLHGVLP